MKNEIRIFHYSKWVDFETSLQVINQLSFITRVVDWYEIKGGVINEIYSPSLKVLSAKNVHWKENYGPDFDNYFWFKRPHYLEFKKGLQAIIYCQFDFSKFPFDTHKCTVILLN